MTKQKAVFTVPLMRAFFLCCLAGPVWADAFPVARCVNLDQALEAPQEGDWGYVIARKDIEWIADQQFDTVRLPVRFSAHWDGLIDPAFLARVDEVIGWADAEGLNVILDLHHFEELMADPSTYAAQFASIWAELSAHYAGADDSLIFELLNEPTEALDTAGAVKLFRDVLPVIRADHPDRWIIIEGGGWASVAALSDLPVLDDRIVLSFHYYVPWKFTHQQAPWMADPPLATGWGDKDDRAAMRADFALAGEVSAPLFLGEFGVTALTDPVQRAIWTRAVRDEAEAQKIGWCHWGLSGNFAILDPQNGVWMPGMREALFADE